MDRQEACCNAVSRSPILGPRSGCLVQGGLCYDIAPCIATDVFAAQNINCGSMPTPLLRSFIETCPERLRSHVQHLNVIDTRKEVIALSRTSTTRPRLLLIAQAVHRLPCLSSIEIGFDDYPSDTDDLIIFHAVQTCVADRLTSLTYTDRDYFGESLLIRLLKQANNLKTLQLEDCLIQPESSNELLSMMATHTTLGTLSLMRCRLGLHFATTRPADSPSRQLHTLKVYVAPHSTEHPWPIVGNLMSWFPNLHSLRFCDWPSEHGDLPQPTYLPPCDYLTNLSVISNCAIDIFALLARAPLRSARLQDSTEPEPGTMFTTSKPFLCHVQKHLKTLGRLILTAHWSLIDDEELDEIGRLCSSHDICWQWYDLAEEMAEMERVFSNIRSLAVETDDEFSD